MRAIGYSLVLWISLAGLGGFAHRALDLRSSLQITAPAAAAQAVDPNKAPSEFNHHMAGWALIGVGLLVVGGFLSPRLRPLRFVWPALFLVAGLFLALWSDAEIWPRGNLSWAWLLHHDQEARQHKIYALLLISLGIIEYLRARGLLNVFWRIWAFPALAVVGAGLLLIHDHTAASGANSPEARAYRVNPALDADGHPLPAPSPDPMMKMDHSGMAMDSAGMDHSGMDHSAMNHSEMDHSTMAVSDDPGAADPPAGHHHHHMTPSMQLVEHEHFWFMIVGLGVALFKLICDAGFWRRRFVPYAWPGGMMLLGVLLVLYKE